MSRAIAARIDRLAAKIGWRHTVLRDDRGREMTVPTFLLLDAWLRVQLEGEPANLPHEVSLFLAGAKLRASDGEMLIALREVCREVWRPDGHDDSREEP